MSRENLKTARINKGFSQNQLSQLLGISNRNYRHLEAGNDHKYMGNVDIWLKLSKILDNPVDYIFKKINETDIKVDGSPKNSIVRRGTRSKSRILTQKN